MTTATSILVCSPVRQDPRILGEFLAGLERLDTTGLRLSFLFFDDNDDRESSALLQAFATRHDCQVVAVAADRPDYVRDAVTHRWKEDLIWRVAGFKDRMLRHAALAAFDFAFLVDSDLVLHPKTLVHLASLGKEIVSEVFWSQWQPDAMFLPQVWLRDHYTLFESARNEVLDDATRQTRMLAFLNRMRDGGCHPVGGLGACTLISRHAIERGCAFAEIDNISFWGEDRSFSIRAAALGLGLWADTRYQPLHLYREADLTRVGSFWRRIERNYDETPRITLSMIVRNEAGRYLRRVLEKHRPLIDEAVIIDDASTDNTVEVARECLEGIPHRIHVVDRSLFENEINLRKIQWEQTVATDPDWILNLDADEMFEDVAMTVLRSQLAIPGPQVMCFRLYDFWSETHYREDVHWSAHKVHRPFMLRYTPEFRYQWKETPLHCGRFPSNLNELRMFGSSLRIKHFGWASAADRQEKYERYKALDPEYRYSIREQNEGILAAAPDLVEWKE